MRKAIAEYDAFLELLRKTGCELHFLPQGARRRTGFNLCSRRSGGVRPRRILCNMGKPQRTGEPAAMEAALRASGCAILGTIQPPGRLEGGDVAWLDERTIAIGHGYRTNAEGIEQLRSFLGDSIEEF